MISFDLKCASQGHRFEGWFRSSAEFDEQRASGLLCCPVCGSADVVKALSAPNVGAKSNQRGAPAPPAPAAPDAAQQAASDAMRGMLAAIASRQAEMLPHSRWVGRDFADAARAMHEGRAPEDLIHGQASPEEARALHDDGIAAIPLLVPVAPPDAVN